MQLDHEFTVPVPAAQAWPVLLDIDRIAPCMPGATVTRVDGDDFEGTVKVKVGPITVTYGGAASFLEKNESDRRAVIEARGRETRGTGTATARVTAQLYDEGEATRVVVSTDLAITGKPAQFGRGVMSDVGAKLLGRFADCLSGQLAGGPPLAPGAPEPTAAGRDAGPVATPAGTGTAPGEEGAGDPPSAAVPPGPDAPAAVLDAPARPEAEAVDLFAAAGGAVAKRVLPALGVAVLLAVLIAVLRRRR